MDDGQNTQAAMMQGGRDAYPGNQVLTDRPNAGPPSPPAGLIGDRLQQERNAVIERLQWLERETYDAQQALQLCNHGLNSTEDPGIEYEGPPRPKSWQ